MLPKGSLEGYVSGPDGVNTISLQNIILSKDAAQVTFFADSGFHPTRIGLFASGSEAEVFAYRQAEPFSPTTAVYSLDDRAVLCETGCPSEKELMAVPLSPGLFEQVEILYWRGNLLFLQMRSSNGVPPQVVAVKAGVKSTLARLLTRPASDQSELDVHLTVMDQETMRRNYGAGMAENYFAVKMDMFNKTDKKLQSTKSAVWFDVDFIETSGRYRPRTRNIIANGSLDLIEANVYDNPFATGPCLEGQTGLKQLRTDVTSKT